MGSLDMKYQRLMSAMFLGLSLMIGSSVMLAQSSTGRVTGSVSDATGSPVPSATINLIMAGSAAPAQTTQSTTEGLFVFSAVQPGNYSVSVDSA